MDGTAGDCGAMSSSLRRRLSTKPGALVTTDGKIPFTWFWTSMLSGAPSTFSAMMTAGAERA
jgi:hypothetical protein